ncbi:MAG: hypothetical protein RQ745_08170 [Longimicrobiales bacterium]|nr:hypothetical protein [Longimicrobiales bacterium]
MTDIALGALVGFVTGLHIASWGMYKDAPHEGFTWRTWVRSPIVAAVAAAALVALTSIDPTTPAGLFVLFAVTYGTERAVVEVYKSFFRSEDQSKYTIPMQFAIRGRVVESVAARWAAGVAYVVVGLLVLWGVYLLEGVDLGLHPILIVLIVASPGGWISAFGGAWKDAPIEGFHTFKFFRSPFVSFSYGVLVATLTDSYPFIFLGSIGLTVATIETYKTFFFPDRPRGKFQGKEPGFPEMLRRRQRVVPLFVSIWLAVLVCLALALTGSPDGLLLGG